MKNQGTRESQEIKIYQYNLPPVIDWTRAVLMVVDMQNDFIHPKGLLAKEGFQVDGLDILSDNVSRLMNGCRQQGIPIIATRHSIEEDASGQAVGGGLWVEMRPFLKTKGFRKGTWGAEIIQGLPTPDFFVDKPRFSAFYQTNLAGLLRGLGCEVIIFSGVATNVCVESTIRDAFFSDFRIVSIDNCMGAYTQQAHEASLITLRFLGDVLSLDHFLKLVPGD